jgi:hypothetical protein
VHIQSTDRALIETRLICRFDLEAAMLADSVSVFIEEKRCRWEYVMCGISMMRCLRKVGIRDLRTVFVVMAADFPLFQCCLESRNIDVLKLARLEPVNANPTQSVSQSASQSVSQSVSQSISQSISQSVSQSVSQSLAH